MSEPREKIVFAGLYSISNPNDEGWSESRFILRPEYRGKNLGTEVKKAIYDYIIKDLISKKVKLIRYYTEGSEALFIPKEGHSSKVVPNPSPKAYTVDSKVLFKGYKDGFMRIIQLQLK